MMQPNPSPVIAIFNWMDDILEMACVTFGGQGFRVPKTPQ